MCSSTYHRKINIKNTKNKSKNVMNIWKYKNIQIRKYANMHGEKDKCEKCKRVCIESKYIYIYIYITIK